MTASDTSTIPTFEPPGPGSWEQDPVHLPRPMTRYFQETHPASFQERHQRFCPLLRAAYRRSPDRLRERLRLQSSTAGAGRGDPSALCACRAGLCAQALARAASRLGRELQTGSRCETPRVAGRRSGRPLRRRAGRLSDTLSRPPFVHDRAAHALHRWCRAADLGFSGPCWRLDGSAALGSVGTDARLG